MMPWRVSRRRRRVPTAAAPEGDSYYLQDTATDDDDTTLTNHSPDQGGPWTERHGSWIISSNQITPTGDVPAGARWMATVTVAVSDFKLSGTLTHNEVGKFFGFVARYTDISNLWRCELRGDGENKLYITEVNDGTPTARANASNVPVPAETPLSPVLVCNGQTISLTLGEDSIQYTSASFNETVKTHGISGYESNANPSYWYDDLLMEDPA